MCVLEVNKPVITGNSGGVNIRCNNVRRCLRVCWSEGWVGVRGPAPAQISAGSSHRYNSSTPRPGECVCVSEWEKLRIREESVWECVSVYTLFNKGIECVYEKKQTNCGQCIHFHIRLWNYTVWFYVTKMHISFKCMLLFFATRKLRNIFFCKYCLII